MIFCGLLVCLFGWFVWLVCLFGLFVCLVGLFGWFVCLFGWFVWLVCLFVWLIAFFLHRLTIRYLKEKVCNPMPGRFKSSRKQNDFWSDVVPFKTSLPLPSFLQTSKKRPAEKVWNRILRSFLDVFSNTDPSKRSLMVSELAEP